MTAIMVAIGFDLAALVLGVAMAQGMSLTDAILSSLAGSALLGVLAISCSLVGSRTGLSSARISRFAFGSDGARVIAFITALTLLGWFGVQAGFLGTNLSSALSILGIEIRAEWLAVAGGLLITWTAVYGYEAMDKIARLSVPLMVVIMTVSIALLFLFNKNLTQEPISHPMSFPTATAYVLGGFVGAVSSFPDISRYAKSSRDAVAGAFFGFFIGNSMMLIIAVILAKYTGEVDLIKLFARLHIGLLSVVVLTIAQWATNVANLYSMSLSFTVVLPEARIPKAAYVIGAGIFGTVLAGAGIADHFLNFLLMVSVAIAPIGGAYSGYYFLALRGRVPVHIPRFVPSTFIAWVSGVVVAWLVTPNDPANGMFGAGYHSLTGVPSVDGFLLAFVLGGAPLLLRSKLAVEGGA